VSKKARAISREVTAGEDQPETLVRDLTQIVNQGFQRP
jgi:hypothetical protein